MANDERSLPHPAGARLSRRSLARAAGTWAAAASLGAAAIQARASAAGRAAAPAVTGGTTTLTVAISYQGGANYTGVQQALVETYLNRRMASVHPGVRVATVAGPSSNGNSPSASGLIGASVAGAGPDVMSGGGWQLPEVLAADLLVPLHPYIRQDNVSLSAFDPGHLAILNRPTAGGLIGLPAYDGPMVLLTNYSMLDALGLKYPNPDWTYLEAEHLWSQIARQRSGQSIWGAGLDTSDPGWMLSTWGGSVDSADGNVCTADSMQGVDAMTWFHNVVAGKIVSRGGNGGVVRGKQAAFGMSGGWSVQNDMLVMDGLGAKWDWMPMPKFPRGTPATYNNGDWYGINAYSEHPPELVWSLFKLVVLDAGFQRLLFQTTFVEPNQSTLWPDWIELVQRAAPPLRTKHLEYYQQAMSYGVCNYRFPFEPAQCDHILNQYRHDILSGTVSAELGLSQAARQINAIQSAAARSSGVMARQSAAVKAAINKADAARIGAYPAPPTDGVGSPPTGASALVHHLSGGAVSVFGAGGDLFQNLGDDGTFVGSAATALSGRFICRVTSLKNVDCPHLSQWAKVGLMARGDLSNNAAGLAVELTGGNGVNVQYRVIPQVNTQTLSAGGAPGLLAAAGLTLPNTKPAANYLSKPLWLMLEHHLNTWQAFTSLDGKRWNAAGPPVVLQVAGAWVGLCATSHDSSSGFRPGQRIEAVFDHLTGFRPIRAAQLGTP